MPNNFKIQGVPKHFSWKPNISQSDLRGKIYVKKIWGTFYSVAVSSCPFSK